VNARRSTNAVAAVAVFIALLTTAGVGVIAGPERYTVTGMVLEVHPSRERFVVSHESISGAMEAMTMAFEVRDAKELDGVSPGARVTFTLVLDKDAAYAEQVRILRYQSAEQDPLTARRLRLLTEIVDGHANPHAVPLGGTVPDFSLIDQERRPIALSQFRGRVVAINFIYTSCALPQFCFRIANQFGVLQRRFQSALGHDLVLLTVTFDPARDRPDVLAAYAHERLKAGAEGWHFLTGETENVRQVCEMFGVESFHDEGLMNHNSHTVVIDRQGALVANIEGNEFTSRQLGDLVDTVLRR
jgi:protein SCO1/2